MESFPFDFFLLTFSNGAKGKPKSFLFAWNLAFCRNGVPLLSEVFSVVIWENQSPERNVIRWNWVKPSLPLAHLSFSCLHISKALSPHGSVIKVTHSSCYIIMFSDKNPFSLKCLKENFPFKKIHLLKSCLYFYLLWQHRSFRYCLVSLCCKDIFLFSQVDTM